MARLMILSGGKFLEEGVGFEAVGGNGVRVLQYSYIGQAYQTLNLNGTDGILNRVMAREDGTGSVGDRVEPADAVIWT